MRVGFVGLGQMGRAMVRNLLRAPYDVTVYNRTRSTAEGLAKEGAKVAGSPAEAAAGEIVLSMVSDDNAAESVVLGAHGIIEGLQPGSLHVSMSTISPDLSQRFSAAHRERGQLYLAAPVFGRPEAAAAAKLFIVAAGSREALDKASPVFEVLGQRTFAIEGRPEQANLIKLLGNFLITCVMESLGEVFAVARKAEIDPNTVFEVLTGTLFGAPVYRTYGAKILQEEFSPAGFKMLLGWKDLRLLMQSAEKLSTPMPFANVVRDRFLSALANGHGELDWSAISLMAAESAGLPAKAETHSQD